MSEMTLPKCQGCPVPLSCCDPMYCSIAEEYSKGKGYEVPSHTGHPKLPFMGATGCILPPHMRPLCTLHTCRINGLGYEPNDPEWTDKYFDLRTKIENLEYGASPITD